MKFTNGGENDEFDVKVTVRIQGGSGDPITLSDTIDQIAPKASATANLALEESPPLGAAVTITRARRAGAGRGEDRQQRGRVPGHLPNEG